MNNLKNFSALKTIAFDGGMAILNGALCRIEVLDATHADGDEIFIPAAYVTDNLKAAPALLELLVRVHSDAKANGFEAGKTAAYSAARDGDTMTVETGRAEWKDVRFSVKDARQELINAARVELIDEARAMTSGALTATIELLEQVLESANDDEVDAIEDRLAVFEGELYARAATA
ncbi:hypothetical protein FHS00_001330 [Limimaricola variabilis]|uniref:DUF4376 domain-containing protein n=1 Tax=Limimaricola variabilis TaxID=1492771 RepID=A0ABR6HMI3_9RHOB|nr:hypothetical protein [Limimaricola variabilis]MBB3711759.1 hypothetical protein [Limimaricola variabilis]